MRPTHHQCLALINGYKLGNGFRITPITEGEFNTHLNMSTFSLYVLCICKKIGIYIYNLLI